MINSLGDENTEFRSGPIYVQELASANGERWITY